MIEDGVDLFQIAFFGVFDDSKVNKTVFVFDFFVSEEFFVGLLTGGVGAEEVDGPFLRL